MDECELLAGAEAHAGVFSRSEANKALSNRRIRYRVKRGRLHRVLPGVYRVTGAPDTFASQVQEAVKWVGDDAVISHWTAARLHGLPRPYKNEARVEVSTEKDLRFPRVKVHIIESLTPDDITEVDGVRVTSPARTLLDLAISLGRSRLEAYLDDVLRRKLATIDQLQALVKRSRGRRGIRWLRRLVRIRSGHSRVTGSGLENKGLTLIRRAGLPTPTIQHPTRIEGRPARVDFFFDRQRIVIELDGYAWHSTTRAFEEDRLRDNHYAEQGWTVLRWTWQATKRRPEALIRQLMNVMRAAEKRLYPTVAPMQEIALSH